MTKEQRQILDVTLAELSLNDLPKFIRMVYTILRENFTDLELAILTEYLAKRLALCLKMKTINC